MYDYSNTETPPCQPSPEAVSPDRPPQLNQAICGCRCGCGSRGLDAGGDGKNDEDAAPTLVASLPSDSGQSDITLSPDREHAQISFNESLQHHSAGGEQMEEVGTKFSSSMSDMHTMALSSHVIGFEERPARPLPHRDYGRTSESLRPEPFGSDDHRVLSERPSIRPISPGPGIGSWIIQDDWSDGVQSEYHFLRRPLRLSPQHRHCRGLVASHLVLRDQVSFMYPMDDE